MEDIDIKKRRAEKAEQLLKDDLIKEAFSTMERSCYNTIKQSKHNETEIREDVYMFMRLMDAFKASFELIIREGVTTFSPPANPRRLER